MFWPGVKNSTEKMKDRGRVRGTDGQNRGESTRRTERKVETTKPASTDTEIDGKEVKRERRRRRNGVAGKYM